MQVVRCAATLGVLLLAASSALAAADVDRGRVLVEQFGCAACHVIPGVRGAKGLVGPPLTAMGRRVYIAGVLPNTQETMVRWLRDPPAIDQRTAMPAVGLSDAQARDVAAFLATLK
jgi:cytochrome c